MFAGVAVVTVTHLSGAGSGSGCSLPAPVPTLGAQLRAIGGFDQAFDPQNRQSIDDVATQAASATSPGLIGAAPEPPVSVAPSSLQRPPALVVPLVSTETRGSPRVVGLVSFLVDCSGRAYFSAVRDLSSLGARAPRSFPGVPLLTAEAKLGTGTPQLIYTSSPFTPAWRDSEDGRTIPAE